VSDKRKLLRRNADLQRDDARLFRLRLGEPVRSRRSRPSRLLGGGCLRTVHGQHDVLRNHPCLRHDHEQVRAVSDKRKLLWNHAHLQRHY
jgi:hypothetical protein